MRRTGFIAISSIILISLCTVLWADQSENLQYAVAPLEEGVPEVAIERLQLFLAQNPSAPDQSIARRKLAEALVRADRPGEALDLFADPALLTDAEATFWHAQALAGLNRWAAALPLYARIAADEKSPLRAEAAFGWSEALRALGQEDRALQVLESLESFPRWRTRAKLGKAQLLLERGDLVAADRLLRDTKPQIATERNEQRFLLGRLNLAQGHPEKAIETLSVILKKPEGFRIASRRYFLRAGRCPFAGQMSGKRRRRARRNSSIIALTIAALSGGFCPIWTSSIGWSASHRRTNCERWCADPAQPRQVWLQWYLARSALRAGDREKAIALLTQLRDSPVRLPSLGEADLELARLHLARESGTQAIAAAEAGAIAELRIRLFVEQADWLIAEANYRSGHLEQAAAIYEQLAQRAPASAREALVQRGTLLAAARSRGRNLRPIIARSAMTRRNKRCKENCFSRKARSKRRKGSRKPAQTFQKFIRDFPQSPRISEAWVSPRGARVSRAPSQTSRPHEWIWPRRDRKSRRQRNGAR